MSTRVWLGLDVGSVSLKTVVLGEDGGILFEDYRRINGRPFAVAQVALGELHGRFSSDQVRGVAVTGSGGKKLAEALGGSFVNEIIALSAGLARIARDIRTAIEIGGQDSKLLLFAPDGGNGSRPVLRDFSMNALCAAGTGSFLDQQASRLGVAIEKEFGELALRSDHPPRIAGRCSVFAKSDMIHLQQIATPVHEIAAGLCVALARSFKSTVGKGKPFDRPVAFLGGVASNAGMVAAFERILELDKGQLVIPPHHRTMGALGAALYIREQSSSSVPSSQFSVFSPHSSLLSPQHSALSTQHSVLSTQSCLLKGAEALEDLPGGAVSLESGGRLAKLHPFLTSAGTPDLSVPPLPDGPRIAAYIGIDVGSVSTNVVAIDSENRLLAKQYLWTASRPIEAVRRGLEEIQREIGDRILVRGVGATGSGRYLIGEMAGADVIRNEITAQATAALWIDPEVDTIFEIGGQDSKYISIRKGTVCDFEMNKACAAGTGSFLSEQAERLGIDLEEEFSPLALDAPHPVALGDRCTVFMESDLLHHQQQGVATPDLLGGLAYSIVHNYLNRVVGDRRVGERIFFQGGTAFNKAVVAAFNAVLGKEVTVPPHHEVTGAIGVAMLARQKMEEKEALGLRLEAGGTEEQAGDLRLETGGTEEQAGDLRLETGGTETEKQAGDLRLETGGTETEETTASSLKPQASSLKPQEASSLKPPASRFRGFDFGGQDYQIKSFVCKSCDNLCEIRQVNVKKEKPLYYGSRCEKYEVDRHAKQARDLPDLFEERENLLLGKAASATGDCGAAEVAGAARIPAGSSAPGSNGNGLKPALRTKGRVGIPMALSFHDVLPFWRAFFEALGFEVALSGPTTKFTVQKGVETVVNETCFPVKVAQGHILQLLDQKPDILFLPSLIDARTEEFGPKDRPVFNCPLVQTLPYTSRSAIRFEDYAVHVLSPALHAQWGLKHMAGVLAQHRHLLGAGKREILAALEKGQAAQDAFYQALERRGQEILSGLSDGQLGLVIVSRPYNGCDLGANLDLPRKIRNLGALPIPMDMLPLSRIPLPERWRKMYWRYGQRILKSAEYIKQDPNLFAVYITNFSCGPDSFVLDFFRNEMGAKPHLLLEIDEHSADAGLITRCEAFLDTLGNLARHGGTRVVRSVPHVPRQFTNHRKVYLPNMSPHAYPVAAAIRSVGVEAVVMAPSDDESVYWGERHTSGRECYPCLLTTGDMVRQTRRPDFDPAKSAFFMASTDGPCRFGQYNHLQRCVLDKLGLEEVPILALEQDSEYRKVVQEIGPRFERRAVTGVMVVDVLEKLLLEKRPYEENPGETEKWFWDSTHKACDVLEKNPRDIWDLLPELARSWTAIPAKTRPRRPLIGVVGEVYVRTNAFANRDLVKSIEALGGQAVVPTLGEWIQYSRLVQSQRNRDLKQYGKMLGDSLATWVLWNDEKRIYRAFGRKTDPSPAKVIEQARPYLDPSFQGEAILTVGKAVELIHQGAAGIVNTMPFTCMPGTICAALLKRVREENGEFPMLNMSFTGQQTTNDQARLEAFIYQARAYDAKTRGETHR